MPNSLKIIFAGTSSFAAEHLAALLQTKYKPYTILTRADKPSGRGRKLNHSPVKLLANENNLHIYQPTTLKDPSIRNILSDLRPDLMVVVAYGLLLPQAVLDIPKYGCINIHASLLPRWRGAAPIQRAILADDKKTGVTIMQMSEKLDEGDILLQEPCEIKENDTFQSLHDRLTLLGAKTLQQILPQIKNE